jgi:protein ImuB
MLAMERWTRTQPQQDNLALALVSEETHGVIIDAVNDAAQKAGISPGMRLTDARALLPTIITHLSASETDRHFLDQLALWARRWGPWTATDGSDGVFIDVTGVPHLFGSLDNLIADIEQRYSSIGLSSRIAAAPNIGAAWAICHYGEHSRAITKSDLEIALSPLPVAALRLDQTTLTLLNRLGLKTIGALSDVPRQSLTRRFRKTRNVYANPLLRLDQVFGRTDESRSPLTTEPPQFAKARVLEPILHVSILKPVLEKLSHELRESLNKRHRGARRLLFEAFRVDGHVEKLQAELAQPTNDAAHMVKLFAERLETLKAGFGFDSIALTATWHEPVSEAQTDLTGRVPDDSELPRLIDRLAVRLGANAVRKPIAIQSHIPERSVKWMSGLSGEITALQDDLPFYERPMRLLDRPEIISVIYATPEGLPRIFQWRRNSHDVAKVEGPERLAPEWWREKSGVRLRDYYKVEDSDGGRYWIYRNGLVGDGRGGVPDWYMHGFFA